MYDLVVVGSGIIGTTVAKFAQQFGLSILVLDSNEQLCGTRPSGGHIKPDWLAGMTKQNYTLAMSVLEAVWEVRREDFVIQPVGIKTSVYRVDTDIVMTQSKTFGVVTNVTQGLTKATVQYQDSEAKQQEVYAKTVVVAAGVWCSQLFPEIFGTNKLENKQGISFRFKGTVVPFINAWAPYKQIVAHQQGPQEIWVGDGTAILQKNWDAGGYAQKCFERCKKSLKTKPMLLNQYTGLRAYCKHGADPCLLQQVGKRVWVATGAGKLGTISAGWVASKVLHAIK